VSVCMCVSSSSTAKSAVCPAHLILYFFFCAKPDSCNRTLWNAVHLPISLCLRSRVTCMHALAVTVPWTCCVSLHLAVGIRSVYTKWSV
jgi:hypothetical protein